MGSYLSRSSGDVEEVDISANTAYRYPPKSGNYFSSHFIMGGNKFETMQPEAYLFGDNSDLNYLGPKPYNIPYKVSSPSQPVKALRCFVNIRKDSLRLVKVPSVLNKITTNEDDVVDQDRQITAEEGEGPFLYNIEFTFDADCPCSITIYYNATEEMFNKTVIFSPDPARDCSDTLHFNPGCNQQFCLPPHKIDPAKLATTTIDWTKGFTKIPIVIQVCADCGPTIIGHSHITYAEFYKPSENTWSIKAIKQKQSIDGVCYLIQEIFGIENKSVNKSIDGDEDDDNDDLEDDGSDCVVCLSEARDTLILPCKHLCLCSTCANQLRYQQSGCPICRQSFRALLQIRAVRKKTTESNNTTDPGIATRSQQSNDDENEEDEVEVVIPVPPGYEVVPLIEAIKGNPTRTASKVSNSSNASTSIANVTLVDETAPVASPSASSRHTINEQIVTDSDSDVDKPKTKIQPLPVKSIKVKETTSSSRTIDEQIGDDNEERLYEEIPNDLVTDNEEKLYEEIPKDLETDEKIGAGAKKFQNDNLPNVEAHEDGSISGSQHSTEEISELEKDVNDQTVGVFKDGTITI